MHQVPHHDFHPLLAELETAIRDIAAAHEEAATYLRRLSAGEVEGTSWTRRIESALDDPAEMQSLKIQRQEAVIAYQSEFLGYHLAVQRIFEVRGRLGKLIPSLAKLAAGLDHKSVDHWLRPIIQNNCLIAAEWHCKPFPDGGTVPNLDHPAYDQSMLPALKTAFNTLAESLKRTARCQTGHSFVGHSLGALYPTDPVTVLPKVRGGNELRVVQPVPFVDTVNTEHPALKRLAEILPRLQSTNEQLGRARHILRNGEKGRVNEKQHAERMVAILDGRYPEYAGREMMAQQRLSRLNYESARIALFAEILAVEDVRRQAVHTLHEAIEETQALEAQIEADQHPTVDMLLTRRLALVNCLAADVLVRNMGRWFKEVHEEKVEDVTNGLGKAAVDEAFADLVKVYRPHFAKDRDSSK